jgi:hypothetical protein
LLQEIELYLHLLKLEDIDSRAELMFFLAHFPEEQTLIVEHLLRRLEAQDENDAFWKLWHPMRYFNIFTPTLNY